MAGSSNTLAIWRAAADVLASLAPLVLVAGFVATFDPAQAHASLPVPVLSSWLSMMAALKA
jgi:hypothetical protein